MAKQKVQLSVFYEMGKSFVEEKSECSERTITFLVAERARSIEDHYGKRPSEAFKLGAVSVYQYGDDMFYGEPAKVDENTKLHKIM